MAIRCNGTKQGETIIVHEDLDAIPDGTEMTIEIPLGSLPMAEEHREKLDEVAGKCVGGNEFNEILADIYRLRDTNVVTHDILRDG